MEISKAAYEALAKVPIASRGESPASYAGYVQAAIREELTIPECQALMGLYGCTIEELVDKIVWHRMHAQR